MAKQIVDTGAKGFGPYSTAVWAGDLLFVSGQIPFDAETNTLIDENIIQETHQVMKNVASVLAHAELTWNDVVKASIFLKNMDDFEKVNEIYQTYFDLENAPARECVEVARLPKNVSIEISVIATK